MTPQSENPTREKKKWREKREKKKWRGSISMKRYNTSRSQKKRGTGYDPSLFTHADTTGREKKMAGTVGCPRRRQNTNTQVSDNSSRNHTHTKKMRPKMQLTVVLRHGKSKSNYSRFPDEPPCKASDAAKESVFADEDPIQGRRPLQKGSTRQVGYNSRGQVTRSGGVCPL